MINFTVHRNAEHEHRVRTALDTGLTNKHARTDAPAATPAPIPAPVGSRPALLDRLGLSGLDISDNELLAVLDSNLAAKAKRVTPAVAKRVQADPAEAAYDKAWGQPAKTAPTPSAADDALYELVWGTSTAKRA